MSDLREQILKFDDIPREVISIPEWNCSLTVCAMTGSERAAWAADAFDDKGEVKPNSRAILIAHTVKDDGRPVFKVEDAPAIEGKNAVAIGRLFAAAKRLNALGADEQDAAEKK